MNVRYWTCSMQFLWSKDKYMILFLFSNKIAVDAILKVKKKIKETKLFKDGKDHVYVTISWRNFNHTDWYHVAFKHLWTVVTRNLENCYPNYYTTRTLLNQLKSFQGSNHTGIHWKTAWRNMAKNYWSWKIPSSTTWGTGCKKPYHRRRYGINSFLQCLKGVKMTRQVKSNSAQTYSGLGQWNYVQLLLLFSLLDICKFSRCHFVADGTFSRESYPIYFLTHPCFICIDWNQRVCERWADGHYGFVIYTD